MVENGGVIYALGDDSGNRFVGMSRKPDPTVDVRARYSRARGARRADEVHPDPTLYFADAFPDTALGAWLAGLPEHPRLTILEDGVPHGQLAVRRREWTRRLREEGAALLNSYPGGKRRDRLER